jgi:hypothetical protein
MSHLAVLMTLRAHTARAIFTWGAPPAARSEVDL